MCAERSPARGPLGPRRPAPGSGRTAPDPAATPPPNTPPTDAGGFGFEELGNGWTVGRFEALGGLAGFVHVVTTRRGPDVSAGPAAAADAVAKALGLRGVAWLRQVHGRAVIAPEGPGPAGDGDALVTGSRSLGLMVQGADCPLILLADPVGGAAGAVHASWRGTVQEVALSAVGALAERFGTRPGDLVGCIGPSAGPCCYEVGPDVQEAAMGCLGPEAKRFFVSPPEEPGKVHFDLWAANTDQLVRAGLGPQNIHCSGVCTICRYQEDLLPSYRVEGSAAGRFVAVIGRT